MEKIKTYVKKHFGKEVDVVDQSTKGWNWGTPKFNGNPQGRWLLVTWIIDKYFTGSVMTFEVENQNYFEIPLSNVNNCQTNKNEVAIEFHQNDEAPVCLMEMRFHIPEDQENDNVQVKTNDYNVYKKECIYTFYHSPLGVLRQRHVKGRNCASDRQLFDHFETALLCYSSVNNLKLIGKFFRVF